jgi:hypothetical protein
MDSSDAGFNFDRYRRLLAEATDERKRLALIDLLIEENQGPARRTSTARPTFGLGIEGTGTRLSQGAFDGDNSPSQAGLEHDRF